MNAIGSRINGKIKFFTGMILMIVAVIIEVITGCAEKYNAIVIILSVIGLLSIVNALFKFPYIIFMAGNFAGMMLYMFIISKYSSIGALFVILFSAVVFLVMWIMEICLATSGTSIKKRLFKGLLVNIIVNIIFGLSVVTVITLSLI